MPVSNKADINLQLESILKINYHSVKLMPPKDNVNIQQRTQKWKGCSFPVVFIEEEIKAAYQQDYSDTLDEAHHTPQWVMQKWHLILHVKTYFKYVTTQLADTRLRKGRSADKAALVFSPKELKGIKEKYNFCDELIYDYYEVALFLMLWL